jgi:competence protein ComGC
MKIIILLLSILLLACTTPKIEIPTEILSEKVCASILKEIHLEEAAFELNKSKGVINAKNSLATSYQSIYKKHNIDDSTFSKSLEYYAKHPEILEEIYSAVLEQLTGERSTLDQQETN